MELIWSAIDAPKTYIVKEITVDLIIDENPSFLSFPCPLTCSVRELKLRICGSTGRRISDDDNTTIETLLEPIRIYYCGELLNDKHQLPRDLFEDDEIHNVYRPRLVVYMPAPPPESEEEDEAMESARGSSAKSSGRRLHKSSKAFSALNMGISSKFLDIDFALEHQRSLLRSHSVPMVAISSCVVENHLKLEEELSKINCAQYTGALRAAGLLGDEGAFVKLREEDLLDAAMGIPKRARDRLLALASSLRSRLGLGLDDSDEQSAAQRGPPRRIYYTRSAYKNSTQAATESAGEREQEERTPQMKQLDARTQAIATRILKYPPVTSRQ